MNGKMKGGEPSPTQEPTGIARPHTPAFEAFPAVAIWMQRLANASIEGVSLAGWQEFCAAVDDMAAVALAARDLIAEGLRLTPDGLIVRERPDRSDPHYRLCCALEGAGLITPSGRRAAIAKAGADQ